MARLAVTLITIATVLTSAGCATIPRPTRWASTQQEGELARCAQFLQALDGQLRKADAIDGGRFRVPGYPYLGVDRFLASFRQEVGEGACFDQWVDHLQALDREARRHEIANLPPGQDRRDLYRRVAVCGDLLKGADIRRGTLRPALTADVAVPDEYIGLRRLAGLYPLTRWFVARGVADWQAEARESFSLQAPAAGEIQGLRRRYWPENRHREASGAEIVARTRRDCLGIPHFSPQDLEALFQFFAPVWEVEIQSDADRIGAPCWNGRGDIDVDLRRPQTYTRLSLARFSQKVLIQLNYIIWFAARPKTGPLDIYGGRLDGVNYRITLDDAGRPLLLETIHNCGCFYKAYPTSRLQVRDALDFAEPPLILSAPDFNPGRERLTISMTARTHSVIRLYPLSHPGETPPVSYRLEDYNRLRSLPASGQSRRSMFSAAGIAPGTQRLERFILWPMGVASPGGMRQWGRQAVSLIGKRHFDDPFDLERMFLPSPEQR